MGIMNIDENVISIVEENVWTSSNCLQEKKVDDAIDISDLIQKQYDFSINVPNSQIEVVLQAEAEKENECIVETADFIMDDRNISNNITSTLSIPIWIMVNKKTRVNRKAKSVGTQMLGSGKLETSDALSHLSNKFDSVTKNELITLQSIDDKYAHNNISNTRNLPNILRGPKILSKSNMSFPIPFETEDNNRGTNNVHKNDISEKEKNRNTKNSHRKRKQIHNPLVVLEDSINLIADTKLNHCIESMEKNKFDSKKAEKFVQNCREETNCKKKPFLCQEIRNQMSFSLSPMEEVTVQNSNFTRNGTTCAHEQTKNQINDLNVSSEFNELYEEQFHEDYTDHFDILTDAFKGYQDLNDSYDNECYDMNSNCIPNSKSKECSKLQYQESHDYDVREQSEHSLDQTNIESNYLSDYEDYFDNNNYNNFLMSTEDLESQHVSSSDYNLEKASIHNLCNKNCLSSFLDESSNDKFCLNNLVCNDLQNPFNKGETRNLDTLLLEEKKRESNLENHLNNDLNSSKINFQFTNDTKNTAISLSNGLEHSTTIRQDESKHQSDQCNVLLNTDDSTNISSDNPEYTEQDNINLSEENLLLVQKSMEKGTEMLYNYTVKLNYESRDDKHSFQVESDQSTVVDEDLNELNNPTIVTEILQCVVCALKFTSKRTLALHVAGAHGGMYVILCERCGRLFNKKCLFNRHFIHCGCVKLPFGCQKCNKTYRHKSSLLHHLKMAHQIERKRNTTKLYKCDVCSKVYRKYGAFEKHLGMHINS